MLRKLVVLFAVCLALPLASLAQSNQPQCAVTVAPSSGAAPLNVTATVNCTDPLAPVTSVTVDWGDNSAPYNSVLGSFTAQHSYNAAGSYVVTVTASDLLGNTSSTSSPPITVTTNQPPSCTLSVSPASGTVPLTVTATGSCTDPENDIASEVLDWGDGTTTAATSGSHTYPNPGQYTVTLTATDSGNLSGSASQTVSASKAQNPACSLTVAPTSGAAPLTVTAVANCSDSDGDTLTTLLSWGDGATTNGSSGAHTYTKAGKFTVTVTATDPSGHKGTASRAVSVSSSVNSAPACTLDVSPASGDAPLKVAVTANCSDPGNDLSSVATDFGDGFYLNGSSAAHTYVSAGSYTVTVSASDKAGNTSQPVSKTVTVTDDPVLFLGISNGEVAQFSRSGAQQASLNSNQGGSMTGMAFDAFENLYTTDFTADTVSKFSGGTLLGTFGSGYNCKPESIAFDRAGNAYVGETGCSHAILKFDAYGNLAAAYSVATQKQGSDWIDLAPDQCTILYTSQGSSVLRYNACARQQLSPFATGLNTGLAVKILPDQSVLVADKQDIVRFDPQGRQIMTYDASGENCWVSLALDSDNASFWAADYCSSDVVQFNINSGNEVSKFNTGTPANTVYGLTERIDPPPAPAAGPLLASPAQASISGGQSATFTLNFSPNGAAAGQSFTLSCADLPVNASCSFSPGTLQADSGPVSAQLTITTATTSARLAPPRNSRGGWILAVVLPCFGVMLLASGGESRRRYQRLLLRCALLACLLPLLSCSGASGNSSSPPASPVSAPAPGSSTPAGTYTVVVRATSAAGPRSSTAVTLNVQ